MMMLLEAPFWLQAALVSEAVAVAWLTARFGWRGAVVGVVAGLLFWLALGFFGSFLISRLEGGRPGGPLVILKGALLGTIQIGLVSTPLLAAALAVGGLLRWRMVRRRPKTW
jgi:hypothetical protein